MRPDGSELSQLTFSETVNWFPHLSPDGRTAVYLAYPPGTTGHPADLWVELMLVRDGEWQRAVRAARLLGGQGTINVNSWSPDSRHFAYVAYPIERAAIP
jgi:TolB protein